MPAEQSPGLCTIAGLVMLAGTRASALALAAELGERAHVGLADLFDWQPPDRLVKEAGDGDEPG